MKLVNGKPKVGDMPHINFSYNTTMGKVFYEQGNFKSMIMDRDSLYPFVTRKSSEMSDYLIDLFSKSDCEVDWTFNYPDTVSRKKHRVIKELLEITIKKPIQDKKNMNRWMSLLVY